MIISAHITDLLLILKLSPASCSGSHKGSKVLVEGRLTPDKSTGGPRVWKKSDGEAAANFEINASTVQFLPSGKAGENHEASAETVSVDESDIPF